MRKLFSTRTSDSAFTIGTLLLRLTAGVLMIPHGFDKLAHFSQKSGQFLNFMGLGPTTSLALVVFAEFFCSAFLIIGLFTRIASIPLIIAMSVALFTAHSGQLFGDGQTAALFLGIYLAILMLGPGRASLDRFIGK